MPHVAEWKKEEVKKPQELIESHPVVGMADLSDIPAPQLQKMRQSLEEVQAQDVQEDPDGSGLK